MKRWAIAIAALAVATASGWFLVNRDGHSVAQDTSCHNPFRNGATRVSPKFVADVAIGDDEWDSLTRVLSEFARDRAWDFKDTSRVRPGVLRALYLSLCNDSLRISVEEQRWARNDYAPAIAGRGVNVAIYGDVPQSEWETVAKEVVSKLEVRWPHKVRFLDGDGYFVERPSFLEGA
jgi:hypothetical protein